MLDFCFSNAVGITSPDIIPDNHVTASPVHPAYGRLYGDRGGMDGGPLEADMTHDWLQVDLGKTFQVCGVATQGDRDGNEWVTDFKVSHSSDGNTWKSFKDMEMAMYW